ncbi:hypothetical protein Tco_1262567 [Tanacetum coccineum]
MIRKRHEWGPHSEDIVIIPKVKAAGITDVALPKHLGNTEPIRAYPLDLHRQEDGNDKGKGVDKRGEDTGDEDLQPYKEDLMNGSMDQDNDQSLAFGGALTGFANHGEDVLEVMQISAFMSNSKCLELGRCFFDQVPKTVTKMMKRVDDFIKSEEFYRSTQLPRGEFPEKGQGTSYRQQPSQLGCPNKLAIRMILANRTPTLQLHLCTPHVGTPKKENLDRYCDYHGEKGHYTNDCYQLKKQLEAALEYEKLSHLVKDVRQRGNARGRQQGSVMPL